MSPRSVVKQEQDELLEPHDRDDTGSADEREEHPPDE
jgi:hypothetical protein